MATAVSDAVPTSFEADLAIFVQLREQEQESLWAQAEWAAAMTQRWGRDTAKMVAGNVGLSAGYVRQLVATANTFPDPDLRAADLDFSHHRIAAMTDDPDYWIQVAVDHQLSVEEMRQAIRDAKDPVAESDEAERAAQRVTQAVSRYNDQWALLTGRRALLTFVAVTDSAVTTDAVQEEVAL